MIPYVGWWEIGARDPGKLRAFYEAVFGWSFETEDPLYLRTQTGAIGGGLVKVRTDRPDYLLFYIEVEEIQAILDGLEAAGGQAVKPKRRQVVVQFEFDGRALGW